ncbi:MAG: YifB family Mg chelatase-like AAA ATPase [Clostridiaceae bacterium]|nr:YifB family Mg chelatase-like AAA ATPase [Clostridiaceae bacterium]
MSTKKYSAISSCGISSMQGVPVEVEVTILPGLPGFEITGLGDSAIREARNRVRAAIVNSGYRFPEGKILASYAPAWIQKRGTGFDLPLALGILEASGQIARPKNLKTLLIVGELALNGEVLGIPGVLNRMITARQKGQFRECLGPAVNAGEAELLSRIKYYGVPDLRTAIAVYSGVRIKLEKPQKNHSNDIITTSRLDNFTGQKQAKRALIIAAAGYHTLLMLGSPGCGKTSLAGCLPGLLPELSEEESLVVTMIQSALAQGEIIDNLTTIRPFFAPHHSVTKAALIGGGSPLHPGLCTRAHLGVLFLDELTEFPKAVLDLLREPLESGRIRIARAREFANWPAEFLMVAAANPCRCGYALEPNDKCRCTPDQIRLHLRKISGPLWDRLNLCVTMQSLSGNDLLNSASARSDNEQELAVKQIQICREIQRQRSRDLGFKKNYLNSNMPISNYKKDFQIEEGALDLLSRFAAAKTVTARSFHNMLRGARTIADLEESYSVRPEHIAEIMQYRLDVSSLV